MRRFRHILSLLLLTTGTINALAAQTSTAPGVHDEQPAGCHDHGKKVPVRPLANYACCVTGHGSAIVQASCLPQPSLQASLGILLMAASPREADLRSRQSLRASSGAPPGATPIRI